MEGKITEFKTPDQKELDRLSEERAALAEENDAIQKQAEMVLAATGRLPESMIDSILDRMAKSAMARKEQTILMEKMGYITEETKKEEAELLKKAYEKARENATGFKVIK